MSSAVKVFCAAALAVLTAKGVAVFAAKQSARIAARSAPATIEFGASGRSATRTAARLDRRDYSDALAAARTASAPLRYARGAPRRSDESFARWAAEEALSNGAEYGADQYADRRRRETRCAYQRGYDPSCAGYRRGLAPRIPQRSND